MAVHKHVDRRSIQSSVDSDLKSLLKEFLKKSEVLEEKENYVLKQVEVLHSAVNSLQSSRRQSPEIFESETAQIDAIEEETKKIVEETKRLQIEIQEKIQSNRALEEEIRQKKIEMKLPEDFEGDLETALKEIDNGVTFFKKKLNNLKELEKRMKEESCEEEEEAKCKAKELKERLAALEWDTAYDKLVIDSLEKLKDDESKT